MTSFLYKFLDSYNKLYANWLIKIIICNNQKTFPRNQEHFFDKRRCKILVTYQTLSGLPPNDFFQKKINSLIFPTYPAASKTQVWKSHALNCLIEITFLVTQQKAKYKWALNFLHKWITSLRFPESYSIRLIDIKNEI